MVCAVMSSGGGLGNVPLLILISLIYRILSRQSRMPFVKSHDHHWTQRDPQTNRTDLRLVARIICTQRDPVRVRDNPVMCSEKRSSTYNGPNDESRDRVCEIYASPTMPCPCSLTLDPLCTLHPPLRIISNMVSLRIGEPGKRGQCLDFH